MRNNRLAALVFILLAVVVAAGGHIVGQVYQFNYFLRGPGLDSNSGTNTIGLPYNQLTNIETAADLLADINASGFGGDVVELQRYDTLTDSNEAYPGNADFSLVPATGFLVRTLSSGLYPIIGSHDPGLVVCLDGPALDQSLSGTHRYTHPLWGVSATASELLDEIGAIEVQRYDSATDSNAPYPGVADFLLETHAAYLIRVPDDICFIPAHY